MAFGPREEPYADSSANHSPHQQGNDCADQSQSHSEQAAAQVLLQPLTQVVGKFTVTRDVLSTVTSPPHLALLTPRVPLILCPPRGTRSLGSSG